MSVSTSRPTDNVPFWALSMQLRPS